MISWELGHDTCRMGFYAIRVYFMIIGANVGYMCIGLYSCLCQLAWHIEAQAEWQGVENSIEDEQPRPRIRLFEADWGDVQGSASSDHFAHEGM